MRELYVRSVLRFCAVISAVLLPTAAFSADTDIPEDVYPYIIVQQDLARVLQEFGQNLMLKVDLSSQVKGVAKGKLPAATAREFLEQLCKMYGLEWWQDGTTLYVSAVSEQTSRTLSLGTMTQDEIARTIRSLPFYTARFKITPAPDSQSVIVSGPPKYAEKAVKTIKSALSVSESVIYRGGEVSTVRFEDSAKALQ